MISRARAMVHDASADRVLLVAAGGWTTSLVGDLHRLHPDWSIDRCDDYLSAIVEVSKAPARVIIACVDPAHSQLDNAVAGLREAAGPDTKLVLCCTTETEPLARAVVAHGADDYVLHPVEQSELDAALGIGSAANFDRVALAAAPAASMEELEKLGQALRMLDGPPRPLLEHVADMLRSALSARGAAIVVEGTRAEAGEPARKPVLTAAIAVARPNGATEAVETVVIGQIAVGERTEGAYTPGEARKLSHYGGVIGHLLQAASTHRAWRTHALTDECTGLPNRRYLNRRLDEILSGAEANRLPVTVLLFDVDDFKSYNDEFGHDAGDEILRITGELFRRHCRERDVVVRFGGDEFAVVFWDPSGPRVAGSTHPDCAFDVLTRFKSALRTHKFPLLGPGGQGRLTISGGLATYPWNATTREQLLTRADQALLAAKRSGKNRIFLIGDSATPPAPC